MRGIKNVTGGTPGTFFDPVTVEKPQRDRQNARHIASDVTVGKSKCD